MPYDVGGISAGTTVASLTGKTLVDLFDDLLFPTVLPTYSLPTMNISWNLSSTTTYKEVGESLNITVTGRGTENDAGSFTFINLYEDNSGTATNSISAFTTGATTNVGDIDGFGQTNPNDSNGNITYTANFSISHTVAAPSSGDRSLKQYKVDGDYLAGQAKNDNKGNVDTRTAGTSSTTPQSAGTKTTGNLNLYGIYPYFYGTSDSQPTASDIVTTIQNQTAGSGITYNKGPISDAGRADGDLQITFGTGGQIKYLWFAIWDGYNAYTDWYATNNQGNNNGSMPTLFETVSVNQIVEGSTSSRWTQNYKIYITLYDTEQAVGGYTFWRQ